MLPQVTLLVVVLPIAGTWWWLSRVRVTAQPPVAMMVQRIAFPGGIRVSDAERAVTALDKPDEIVIPFEHAVLVIDYPPEGATGREEYDPIIAALIAAARATGTQGLVVSVLPELLPETVRDRLVDAGMAPLQGLEEAMAAFAAAARLERRWAAADALPALPPAAAIAGERRLLDEWQSKQLLARRLNGSVRAR